MNSTLYNRTLFLEDNLPVLRGLDSDSIDLIATDPPFNKGVPAFTGTTKAGQNVEFKDVWNWNDDVHVEWMDQMSKRHPSLSNVIRYANAAAGDDMGAFLCWMAVRVLEMHRVLKDTGSIYLHCDPTASHYLKAMMDAIFGRKQFRRELIWQMKSVSGFKSQAANWIRDHDIIFYYSKTGEYVFNKQLKPYRQEYVDKMFKGVDEDGRRYRQRENRRYYADEGGVPFGSVWDDIHSFQTAAASSEITGYPTQKPLALYKRMIQASSNPGDMVLDPFAGCATTCVAAEQLGRDWIGIDIREESGDVIRERLENEVNGSMEWNAIVRTPTEAPERTDDGEPAAPELMLVSPKRVGRRIPIREVRDKLIVRDGQRCQGCGWVPHQVDYLQVDHNQPRSLEGTDEMDNLALLCEPCNRKKSNKLTLHELRLDRASDGGWMNMEWWEKEKWKR